MNRDHVASTVLAGGRAPDCQRRILARSTARLDFVRRACVWIKEFAKLQPVLCNGPLFGDCLSELAAQIEAPDKAFAEPRARRLRSGSEQAVGKQGQISKRSARCEMPSKPGTRVPVTRQKRDRRVPFGRDTPQRDKVELLRSLASKNPLADRYSAQHQQPRARTSRPATGELFGLTELSEIARNSTPRPDMIALDASQTRWLSDIAERAGHRLRTLSNLALPRIEHGALADQWAIPMNGPVASAEVLARLANDVTQGNSNSKGQLHSFRRQPPRLRTSAGVATGNDRTDVDHDPKSNSERSSQWTSWMPETLPPLGTDFTVPNPALASKVPTHAVPLVDGPFLPSLLPQQAPRLSVRPVAATTDRHDLQDEDSAGREDELSNLSLKIKQILDEEARRHGINV